jgi:hypothetical protein
MQGSPLRGKQVVQLRQGGEPRRLTPPGMLAALHPTQGPVDGVLGLRQSRAQRWPRRGGEPRLPPRLRGLNPAPPARAMGRANGRGAGGGPPVYALPQRHDSSARALATAVAGGGARRAATLAPRRREAAQRVRELVARVAETLPPSRPRPQGLPPAGGAVDALGEGPAPLRRGRLLEGRALRRPRGRRAGCGTLGRAGPQGPEPVAPADGGQRPRSRQAPAGRFSGPAIPRQRPRPPGPPRAPPRLAPGTAHAGEGQRGTGAAPRPPCETAAAGGGQPGGARHGWAPLALTPDERRQDGAHGWARRTLATPAGETIQADTGRVGVAGQTPALATAGLGEELKAASEQQRAHERAKRFGGAQDLSGGRLLVAIDGARAVVACRFGGVSPVSSPSQRPWARMRPREGHVLTDQASGERLGASPLHAVECGPRRAPNSVRHASPTGRRERPPGASGESARRSGGGP